MDTSGQPTGQEFSALSANSEPVKASKKTRFEVIHDLLESQGEAQPTSTAHNAEDMCLPGLVKRSSTASWVKFATTDRLLLSSGRAIQLIRWSELGTPLNVDAVMPAARSTVGHWHSRRSSGPSANIKFARTSEPCWNETSCSPTAEKSRTKNTYIHTYIHTCVHAYTHTCIRAYIHAHMHTYKHTYIHIHTYIHTCMHAYIHTYIHTNIHTYIHTHTQTHTYTHTYTRIHTHTYTYIHIRIHTHTGSRYMAQGTRWLKHPRLGSTRLLSARPCQGDQWPLLRQAPWTGASRGPTRSVQRVLAGTGFGRTGPNQALPAATAEQPGSNQRTDMP